MARITDRLRDYAENQHLPFEKISYVSEPNALGHIEAVFNQAEQVKDFKSKALDQFRELVVSSESEKKLALQLDPNLVQSAKKDSVDQTINTITTRIDKMGVTEPSITKRGNDQIQIQLAGYSNSKEARSLIGRTAQLEFQLLDDDNEFLSSLTLPEEVKLVRSAYGRPGGSSGKDLYLEFPESKLSEVKSFLADKTPDTVAIKYGSAPPSSLGPMMRTYTLIKRVALTGDDLVDAHVSMGSMDNPRPAVALTFSTAGGRTFATLTKDNIGKRLGIILEDNVDSAPVIQTEIPNGTASITMGGARNREEMIKEANQLSLVLKAGALPAPVTFREERSVGPSLGADSVKAGSLAFLVGATLVAIFMLFYYRVAGFISLIGVTFNVAFILAFMSLLGATMTLPGVAALLLTVGMAVDT
ncbi:MAG TPA: protein translocase subunit SecD, partial [Myxococcota bacterium]|nr:protein translocase subunit SecD [Myxococcota bacterium]